MNKDDNYFNRISKLPPGYDTDHAGFFSSMAELNALGTNWQLGMTATVNGSPVVWRGASAGGWVEDVAIVYPSGSDDTAALNAALSSGGNVRLMFGATYNISDSLLVPSDTRFDINGATISATGTTHRMIQNAGYGTTRNENIEIFGGTLSAGSIDGNTHRLVMLGVDGLKIHDMEIKSSSGKYAILLADVYDFLVHDIAFDVASDGVHVTGPVARGGIHRITGTTGDDFVALGCSDYLAYDVSRGNINDIVIDGLFPLSLTDGGSGCKLFTVGDPSITNNLKIRNVSIKNVYGSVKEHGVVLMDYAANNGSFENISIENVSVKNSFNVGWAQVAISPNAPVSCVSIKNVAIPTEQTLTQYGVLLSTGAKSAISIDGIFDASPDSTQTILLYASGSSCICSGVGVKNVRSASYGAAKRIMKATNSSKLYSVVIDSAVFSNYDYAVEIVSNAELYDISLKNVKMTSGGGVFLTTPFLTRVNLVNIIQTGGTLVMVGGASSSAEINGSGRFIAGGSSVWRSATQSVIVRMLDFNVDLTSVTKANGGAAYNTNAGLSCGVGAVVSDGSVWKNLVSGLTY